MNSITLFDLQATVQDKSAFGQLADYFELAQAFLKLLPELQPTRIVSPNDHRYIFFQYGETFQHKITRPLNSNLFIEDDRDFRVGFERFTAFLDDLKWKGQSAIESSSNQNYLSTNEINKVVYTCQQIVGCIGDSFSNPNQSRKRVGQLFEDLVKQSIKAIGFSCESRRVIVPIPDLPDATMSYELDLVFSKKGAIVTSETALIHPNEVVGSVKTTSKDRIDKIFLDKLLLSKLLGQDIKVVAIFLHDVQRARRANSIFGVNATFKTNHFLGYTVALNRLDGVYYVDPRAEMVTDSRLNQEIDDFQFFLTRGIWQLVG